MLVATFKREKRPELFLQLAEQNPAIRFRMVGGPSRYGRSFHDQIKHEAEKLDNLEFIGFVPYAEVNHHFNGARVFVNTSDYEGFPNTFLQSWSRQLPTVSFINLNTTHHNKPVGRSVATLADMSGTVHNLMEDDELWLQEGLRCQQYFDRNHTVSSVVNRFEEIFRELVAAK